MGEHTPDPWEINDEDGLNVFVQHGIPPYKGIARIYRQGDVEWGDDAPVHCEAEANGRLIRAAPELLAALELMVSLVNEFAEYDPMLLPTYAKAVAIIAKAKGE